VTLTALGASFASFGLLVLVFTPLERAMPARAGQRSLRPEWAIDACFFFGQYLLWTGLASLVLGCARQAIEAHSPAALGALLAPIPTAVQAAAAVVLGDLLVYGFHRACHRFDWLWRFHAVHHSAQHLDWLAAHREHPLDGLGTQLCQNLPLLVIGLRLDILAPLIVFRGAWGIFIHSNVRLPLGPLGLLFGAPELHHWHHARLERTRHNFANLAPWLDVLFGTYHRPDGEEDYALGIEGPWPRGYIAQLAHPFYLTGRALAASVKGLVPHPSARSAGAGSISAGCVRSQSAMGAKTRL
jgi:sterol desaturase/sphingolipid hydroxylase (fatty acid hydroxylase superfamily)